MNKTRKPSQRSNKGYALLITVVFIGIALLLLGSVMDWTNSSTRQAERNNIYSSSSAAAEAADEIVIAYVSRDFINQSYQSVSAYETNLPNQTNWNWPVTYSFQGGTNGATNQTSLTFGNGGYGTNWPPPVWQALGWQYQGLSAFVIPCTVVSTATARNQPYTVPATVTEQFELASIPLAQFALFYNMDMEICPGANMTVGGKVYVNGTIWANPGSGDTLTFNDKVSTTAPKVIYARNPNDQQASNSNPVVVYLDTNSPATNQPVLTLPVGTNAYQMNGTNSITNNAAAVAAILDLPPAGVDPASQLGQEYLYNQSDIILSNAASTTNLSLITGYFQDSNNVSRLTPIPNDFTNIIMTVRTNAGVKTTNYFTNIAFTFATNTTFYDYREGKTVQAVQLDVGALNIWLNGAGSSDNNTLHTDTGHYIDSIYIYNNATASSTNLPAVRVADGATLPTQGLTVVTPDPLYVLGNYNASASDLGTTNVADTAPAAFLGDAITILSTSWSDTYNSGTPVTSRNAGNTTVNAATLEGIVQSVTVNGNKHYSGGVENFLRLLENWSGDTLTYNGSITVMFYSRYATNYWQVPGNYSTNYYNPPKRNWGFDANFTQGQNKLPPIFPCIKAMIRTGWSAN